MSALVLKAYLSFIIGIYKICLIFTDYLMKMKIEPNTIYREVLFLEYLKRSQDTK